MSSLWILRAKAWAGDTRSSEASAVSFWLKPGSYTVGRHPSHCDLEALEDKTISRIHATITVPNLDSWGKEGGEPYVVVSDSSRYGTLVTSSNELAADGVVGQEFKAHDQWIVRFGFSSPFKLYNQKWTLYIHPDASKALLTSASALGLPLVGDPSLDTARLVMPETTARADGFVLWALLSGRPVVGPGWVTAWDSKKVWKNQRPLEADYPVELVYLADKSNVDQKKSSEEVESRVSRAREKRPLAGFTLVWPPASEPGASPRGKQKEAMTAADALRRSAEVLGAKNVTYSTTKAAAKRLSTDAIFVKAEDADTLPSAMRDMKNNPWLTYDGLIAAVLTGNLKEFLYTQEQEMDLEMNEQIAIAETPTTSSLGGNNAESGGLERKTVRALVLEPDQETTSPVSHRSPRNRKRDRNGSGRGKLSSSQIPETRNINARSVADPSPSSPHIQTVVGSERLSPSVRLTGATLPGWRASSRLGEGRSTQISDDQQMAVTSQEALIRRGTRQADAPIIPNVTGLPRNAEINNGAVVLEEPLIDEGRWFEYISTVASIPAPGRVDFKAFRRKNDYGAQPPRIVAFDAEPYVLGGLNDEAFIREEREKKRAREEEDAAFRADIKVKRSKAAFEAGQATLMAYLGRPQELEGAPQITAKAKSRAGTSRR